MRRQVICSCSMRDLISSAFLSVGLIAGWDIHLIPTVGYGRVFVSHDEWIGFRPDHTHQMDEIKEQLITAKIKIIDG
jgi:hypothetical protein